MAETACSGPRAVRPGLLQAPPARSRRFGRPTRSPLGPAHPRPVESGGGARAGLNALPLGRHRAGVNALPWVTGGTVPESMRWLGNGSRSRPRFRLAVAAYRLADSSDARPS